jgi:hypothetical protein
MELVWKQWRALPPTHIPPHSARAWAPFSQMDQGARKTQIWIAIKVDQQLLLLTLVIVIVPAHTGPWRLASHASPFQPARLSLGRPKLTPIFKTRLSSVLVSDPRQFATMSTSALSFAPSPSSSTPTDTSTQRTKFGPRTGRLVLERSTPSASTSSDSPASSGQAAGETQAKTKTRVELDTPALFTTTSRGVVPHISRDHYDRLGGALKWTCVPFETL